MAAVLLAIDELDDAMRVALARAHALAAKSGATLHVLRVVAAAPSPGSFRAAPLVELFNAERELRRELGHLLEEPLPPNRLRVCSGDFAREVSASASRDRAQLVVLADAEATARRAATITRQTRVPVLVARKRRESGPVVGTTALEHRRYPVIRRASEVSKLLDAPLVVLHNLPAPQSGPVDPDDTFAASSCRELLEQVTTDFAPSADVLVARHDDPLDAIVEADRLYECDLLVVGARVGGALRVEPSLAESVIHHTRSSVLVTPLE